MSFYLLYFLILVIYFYFTTHSFKISNAVIATSISIPNQYVAFRISKKKKRKEKGKRKSIYLPIYYDSLKKCIYPFMIYPIYSPTLLQPFIYPFYYNNFCLFYYIYSLCIALPFIHLLYFNCIFNFLLLQNMYFFFLSELGD
jgi:hypothetical protein